MSLIDLVEIFKFVFKLALWFVHRDNVGWETQLNELHAWDAQNVHHIGFT